MKKEFKAGDVIYLVLPPLDDNWYSITIEKTIEGYIEKIEICDSDIQDDGYIEYNDVYYYPDSYYVFYNRKEAIECAIKEAMECIDNLKKVLMERFNAELENETNNKKDN